MKWSFLSIKSRNKTNRSKRQQWQRTRKFTFQDRQQTQFIHSFAGNKTHDFNYENMTYSVSKAQQKQKLVMMYWPSLTPQQSLILGEIKDKLLTAWSYLLFLYVVCSVSLLLIFEKNRKAEKLKKTIGHNYLQLQHCDDCGSDFIRHLIFYHGLFAKISMKLWHNVPVLSEITIKFAFLWL